jgi:hypothetical protein
MPHARKIDVPLADRLAFSVAEVSGLTGFSVSHLYDLIKRGAFRTKLIEGRRIATPAAVAELLGVASLAEVLGTSAEASREQPPAPATDTVVPLVATTRPPLSRVPSRPAGRRSHQRGET